MKIMEVYRVSQPPGSENLSAPTSLPLTFFDILWLRLPPVQRLFFYEFPHPPPVFFDSLLPKLKHSLSLSLQYFLPLAGNLTWPHASNKPIITYVPGDAVNLTVAQSDADFDHLSGNDLSEASESHNLTPHLTISHEKAAILALQISLFPNSGFCIGIASHHAVADGKTSTSFMKSWAYLCKRVEDSSSCSLPPELIPFFKRDLIKDPNQIEARYIRDWLHQDGPNNRSLLVWDLNVAADAVRGIFELTLPDIEKLKQFIAVKLKGCRHLHVSTFTVACAYAWVCKVKAEAEELEGKRVRLAINVDCRSRLVPPVPSTYFGNCIACRFPITEARELLGENGFIVAMEAIGTALETLKDGVLAGAEDVVSYLTSLKSESKIIGCAGTPRFEVYSTDFGWGRPKKVEMASIDRSGALCLAESRNFNGGVEIGLVLKKNAMEAFSSFFVNGLESL